MADWTLRQLQQRIDDVIQSSGGGYFSPMSNLARLCEELGEIARIVNHEYGDKPKKPGEVAQTLGEEIADLVFAAVCLLNSRNLDLQGEIERVVAKCEHRDRGRFATRDGEP